MMIDVEAYQFDTGYLKTGHVMDMDELVVKALVWYCL